jgi:bifunctional DNA-binding transcriptional regulator/antitoxin component of YhaV-PrlF toxin-antitoxin module
MYYLTLLFMIMMIVSIPKKIANTMKLKKGESLRIYTHGEKIYLDRFEEPTISRGKNRQENQFLEYYLTHSLSSLLSLSSIYASE